MNIHIRTDDPTVVAAIAEFLSTTDYGRIEWVTDNHDSYDVEPDRAEAVRSNRGGRIEASRDLGQRLMSEISEQERQWRMRRDMERYAVADAEYPQYLTVACPHCQAKVDEACHRPTGQVMKRPHVHATRRRDWMLDHSEPVAVEAHEWAQRIDLDQM